MFHEFRYKVIKKLHPVHTLFNIDKDLEDKIKTKQHYMGDMHTHPFNPYSNHLGEGISPIDDIVYRALKHKIKVLAFTPHFSLHNIKKIDEKITYLNDLLNKGDSDYDPIIPIYGTELGWFNHKLIYAFGVNQKNAKKVEWLGHTLKQRMSLEQLTKIEKRFNDGEQLINGYFIPSGLSDVRIVIAPAHYKSGKGVGLHEILSLYEAGGHLTALETTNTSSWMFQDSLGQKLRDLFGDYGPTDLGGSDAHWDRNVGMGYTSFTVPKKKINNSLDVYDCIINKQTTTNYLRVPSLKRRVLSRYHYTSPTWWFKFPLFLAMR